MGDKPQEAQPVTDDDEWTPTPQPEILDLEIIPTKIRDPLEEIEQDIPPESGGRRKLPNRIPLKKRPTPRNDSQAYLN